MLTLMVLLINLTIASFVPIASNVEFGIIFVVKTLTLQMQGCNCLKKLNSTSHLNQKL